MNVDSIRDGIVIDHIAAGCGMKLYRLLGLESLDISFHERMVELHLLAVFEVAVADRPHPPVDDRVLVRFQARHEI